MCYTYWSNLSWDLFLKFSTNGYPSLLCSKDFFSSSMQMGSHISSLLKNFSFQVLWKLVPMFSFPKIFMKLQVADPTHEQIKYAQTSIKSIQIWSSIKNSSLKKNPLPTNPIDSNQLSLKLWLKINHALEASWKYLTNHVWWCCVKLYLCLVHSTYGGLLVGYNEIGSTSSVKVMNHANMLLWAMDHPPPTKMHVILTLQDGAFKDVVH